MFDSLCECLMPHMARAGTLTPYHVLTAYGRQPHGDWLPRGCGAGGGP